MVQSVQPFKVKLQQVQKPHKLFILVIYFKTPKRRLSLRSNHFTQYKLKVQAWMKCFRWVSCRIVNNPAQVNNVAPGNRYYDLMHAVCFNYFMQLTISCYNSRVRVKGRESKCYQLYACKSCYLVIKRTNCTAVNGCNLIIYTSSDCQNR